MFAEETLATVILTCAGDEVTSWPLTGGRPDIAVVDQVARLQLAARRLGCSIRLHDPRPELTELLELVGLSSELRCNDRPGQEDTAMPNPVVHFEIMGKDGAASQRFYAELFGWAVNADNPMGYGVVEAQDGAGIGGGVGANPQGATYVTVYVAVDDLQACLDKAESLGATTVMGPTEIPGVVTMAIFNDPDGNMIGLIKNEPPPG